MHKQQLQEAYALDRILDTLAEGSMIYLAEEDPGFGRFLTDLYTTVNDRSASLRRTVATR